jgi:hypothetical protein
LKLEADVVLVAIGRRPYTEGLNLEKLGIELDPKGRVVIDNEFNTSVKSVKCIGDATFGPMLAHKAEDEGQSFCAICPIIYVRLKPQHHCAYESGVAAVEHIHAGHGHVNYNAIPSVIYTHPEVRFWFLLELARFPFVSLYLSYWGNRLHGSAVPKRTSRRRAFNTRLANSPSSPTLVPRPTTTRMVSSSSLSRKSLT